jgi:uncharacterized protein (DUF4213/DUF364 family)
VVTLTTEEAIGKPSRQDFALLEGKEVMIEAQFKESFGQAFTSQPQDFYGSLGDILDLDLNTINNRAIFIASLNAVCSHLGIIGKVRHCRDQEPEECGQEMADTLKKRYGNIKIGLVGYQPAILENLVKVFGANNVQCSDLNTNNIGANKFGVNISDGSKDNRVLINWCDLVLVTGSTHANDTFDEIYNEAISRNKDFLTFGVTAAGIAALLKMDIVCPLVSKR